MIAMVEKGYYRLAKFTNVVFVFLTWSCAVSNLFIGSRTLYALAGDNHVPRIGNITQSLATTTRRGVPLSALIFCTLWGFFGILGLGDHQKAQKVLYIPLTTILFSC